MQGRLNAFTEIEVTRDEVERTLKKAADLIRTRVGLQVYPHPPFPKKE